LGGKERTGRTWMKASWDVGQREVNKINIYG